MTTDLLEKLRWRYATKQFDPEKKISDSDWSVLEEALRLTPSSYGMQPWKFFVIRNQELKDGLVSASYNQRQVADCSHLLVFAVPLDLETADVDKLIDASVEARGATPDSLAFYRDMIIGDVVEGPRSKDTVGWGKLQSYIALGNLMTCAAILEIDACPMEGFVPAMYDDALDLLEKGYTTAVVCPLGYRSAEDKYAGAPKVRYPADDVFVYVD